MDIIQKQNVEESCNEKVVTINNTDTYSKMYIAVLEDVPDYMVPTLVAHAVLGAHLYFEDNYKNFSEKATYIEWLYNSFRKCVVKVNRKEFEKIKKLGNVYLAHENTPLNGEKSCAIPLPVLSDNVPNVLKFSKLWKPGGSNQQLAWVENIDAYSAETCLGLFEISKQTGHATLYAYGAKPKFWYKVVKDTLEEELQELQERILTAHNNHLVALKKWF